MRSIHASLKTCHSLINIGSLQTFFKSGSNPATQLPCSFFAGQYENRATRNRIYGILSGPAPFSNKVPPYLRVPHLHLNLKLYPCTSHIVGKLCKLDKFSLQITEGKSALTTSYPSVKNENLAIYLVCPSSINAFGRAPPMELP